LGVLAFPVFYDSMAVIATRDGDSDVVSVPEKQNATFQSFRVSRFQGARSADRWRLKP
jgi:hypothetical protein